jgi:hypothetical protein
LRTSWPANLPSLIRPLEAVVTNGALKLTDEERRDLRSVIDALQRICKR